MSLTDDDIELIAERAATSVADAFGFREPGARGKVRDTVKGAIIMRLAAKKRRRLSQRQELAEKLLIAFVRNLSISESEAVYETAVARAEWIADRFFAPKTEPEGE